MLYRRYTPPPPLAAFVACLWYSEGLQGTHERERLLPNGESGIVFDLRDGSRRRPIPVVDEHCDQASYFDAVFCGARTDSFLLDTSEQERAIGIQFRPGGAFPFLGMPASEAANATYSLEDLWPRDARLLREALLAAPSIHATFAVLENALRARFRVESVLHPAVAFAINRLGSRSLSTRVSDVADRAGLSSRRLIDLFHEQTGLTPKAFHRVRRFQHVLQALRARSVENCAALAADTGYFDQSHFIHDFRRFSGLTPGEYLTLATPHLNHVPLK
jgi:AraC-like DNA-binding protein